MKTIVLGGGYDQIALIEHLKAYFDEIILIDFFENPIAKKHATKHYCESTLDNQKVLEIASKEKVDFIITACTDQALMTMASVSETLHLPCYLDNDQTQKITNKKYMKEMFAKHQIPTAKFISVKSLSELDIHMMNYPVIVKPADCNSSKGVNLVQSTDALKKSVKNAMDLSRTNTAIIEEYMIGKEISVDAFVKDGKSSAILITETIKRPNTNGFTICKSSYPPQISTNQKKCIAHTAQKIADAFSIQNSPLLIQMIVDQDSARVIEFSARMGGGTKYRLVNNLTSFDIMREFVNMVLGNEFSIQFNETQIYAQLTYCYSLPGRFSRLHNFDKLVKEKIIQEYYQYKAKGTIIEKAETSGDRVAGYYIQDEALDIFLHKCNLASNNLQILSDRNRDIMIQQV